MNLLIHSQFVGNQYVLESSHEVIIAYVSSLF